MQKGPTIQATQVAELLTTYIKDANTPMLSDGLPCPVFTNNIHSKFVSLRKEEHKFK